jgi:hypothetical protein
MKENKNIERLFQEKFKDFEVQPPQDAWATIEKRLNEKKKKRRVIPIWFKVSGIAASLVLGFFLYNFVQNSFSPGVDVNGNDNYFDTPGWVNGNTNGEKSNSVQSDEKSNLEQEYQEGKGTFIQPGQVITDAGSSSVSGQNLEGNQKKENVSNEDVKDNSQGAKEKQKERIFKKIKSKEVLVQTPNKSSDSKKKDPRISKWVDIESQENVASVNQQKTKNKGLIDVDAQTDLTKQLNQKQADEKLVSQNQKEEKGKIAIEKEKNGLNQTNAQLSNSSKGLDSESESEKLFTQQSSLIPKGAVDFNAANNITQINTKASDSLLIASEKGILAEIEKNKDSSQVAEVLQEENALEKLLKEKEEGKNADEKEKEEKRNKWAVSTNAAPVYFNSLTEGSPLDDQFASNAKTYQTSLSYGAGVQYQVTSKLALRAGVNSLAFSYDTQNVYYSTTLQARLSPQQNLQNDLHVNKEGSAQNVILYNKKVDAYGDVENFSQEEKGSLNQQIGYIEIPLEMSYKLLNKKFGIEIIGGMSTLFLQQNEVKLQTEGMEMNIGKANNLNNIHFSSNVGLGFKYDFLKAFQANFQPMFKYQINTFSENSGSFKPYVIGLYTGISYHF